VFKVVNTSRKQVAYESKKWKRCVCTYLSLVFFRHSRLNVTDQVRVSFKNRSESFLSRSAG